MECILCAKNCGLHSLCYLCFQNNLLDKSFNPHFTDEETKQLRNTQVPTYSK